MQLILWRHADAEDAADDLERILSKKGRKQAKQIANWLNKRLDKKTLILSSAACRAVQTADYLSQNRQISFKINPLLNPNANIEDILHLIAQKQDSYECIVIVGHQPYLGQLASRLLCGSSAMWSLRKGGFIWLEQRGNNHWRIESVLSPTLLSE